jgi:hypothetical protein
MCWVAGIIFFAGVRGTAALGPVRAASGGIPAVGRREVAGHGAYLRPHLALTT